MKFLERAFDQQNQIWKYLIVFLVAFYGGQFLGSIPLFGVMMYKVITSGGNVRLNLDNFANFSGYGISNNLALFLLLFAFVVALLLAILLIKILHKRSFAETVNGTRKVRIKRCFTGAAVWGVLLVVFFLIDYLFNKENFRLQFNLSAFIPLLFISVIMLTIQSTCEEFIFRGYLTQGVAGLTKNRWLAILLPALLFGLVHSFNPEIKEFGFWIMMAQYVFLGLLFGVVSVLDDGIELAIGMHVINNILGALLATNSASALQTDAIFEEFNIVPVQGLIGVIILGIISFAFFAWKYKWNFKILNQKIINV